MFVELPSSAVLFWSLCRDYYYFSLTNSVKPSLSWEASNFSSGQEVLSTLWNLKAYWRLHKIPPLGPVPNQMNRIRTLEEARGGVVVLRHHATSRKVAGSIPHDVIGFFSLPNTYSCTMALGSTQPLTKKSRNLPGDKGRPTRKADNLTAMCEPTV
jgi:hypothetical protein